MALTGLAVPLRDRFDPRRNSVNAVRLVLAVLVLVSHSITLSGGVDPIGAVTGGVVDLGTMAVDGFFALSGFLIARSFLSARSVGRFLWHRALRILPGFWVCLLVTAAVLLPVSQLAQFGTMRDFPISGPESVTGYVVTNWGLLIRQFEVRGLMGGHPVNGSLYTLFYEFLCYLGVAALGVAGLLRRRRLVGGLAAAIWLVAAADLVADGAVTGDSVTRWLLLRFGVTFASGVLLFLWADRVPLAWPGAVVAGLLTAVAVLLAGAQGADPASRTTYLLIAPAAVAYLVLWAGSATWLAGIGRRVDLSYGIYVYAWPIQVLLLQAGAAGWPVVLFLAVSAVAAAGLALLSWRFVESPALALKSWTPSGRRG